MELLADLEVGAEVVEVEVKATVEPNNAEAILVDLQVAVVVNPVAVVI